MEQTHLVWDSALRNVQDLDRLILKARLVNMIYSCHGKRVHYEAEERMPICKLCQATVESREYMLIHCPALIDTRQKWWIVRGYCDIPDIKTLLDHISM